MLLRCSVFVFLYLLSLAHANTTNKTKPNLKNKNVMKRLNPYCIPLRRASASEQALLNMEARRRTRRHHSLHNLILYQLYYYPIAFLLQTK